MADIKKLAEELVKLTILEANELKNHLKDEYGIEPAAVAVAAAAGAADAAAVVSGRDHRLFHHPAGRAPGRAGRPVGGPGR